MKKFYFILLLLFCSLSYGQVAPSNEDIEGFKLYPNPVTNNKVFVQTNSNLPKTISIFDVFGTLVLQTKIKGKELNLSDIEAGVYVLRVTENNKVATRKLIIK